MLPTGNDPIGVATADLTALGERTVAAWDALLELTEDVDLNTRTRLPGWRLREVLIHLGTWDDYEPLADAIASARAGGAGPPADPEHRNARLVRAHAGATYDDVRAALARSRDVTVDLTGGTLATLARKSSMSSLGPLPLATYVHASCYEIAVHAIDVAEAAKREPPPELLDAGLAALMDVTGQLASRLAVDVDASAQTPQGGWRYRRKGSGWVTEQLTPGTVDGVAVHGTHRDLLDASAGRANIPALLLQRRLRVQHLGRLLELGAIVTEVPHLPGGAVLGKAATGVAALAGRLKFLR